jgi:single-stranded DNA-binding protein
MWGKRGEALARILAKGERVFVEGSLRTSSYEKDGEKRYRTEIVASNIILNGAVNSPNHRPRPAPAASCEASTDDYEGADADIPF